METLGEYRTSRVRGEWTAPRRKAPSRRVPYVTHPPVPRVAGRAHSSAPRWWVPDPRGFRLAGKGGIPPCFRGPAEFAERVCPSCPVSHSRAAGPG